MSMPESETSFPQVVPCNGEIININNEDTVEDQVYELVNSSSDEGKEKFAKNKAYCIHDVKRRKNRYIWILIPLLIAIVLFSVCIALHSKPMPSYNRYEQMTDLQRKFNMTLKPTIKYAENKKVFVQAVAYGSRYVTVGKDQRFTFWQLQKMHGNVTFRSMTFIVVEQSGVYKVYAQITYKPNGTDASTSILLMRNNDHIVSRCSVTNCKEVCTMYMSKLVALKKGDYIFLKAAKKGEFIMDREMTYFGAVSV